MCVLLFKDATTAQEVGYILRAKFDGLNAISLLEPIDETAVRTALALCQAECCAVGDYCSPWFYFQFTQIEVELNRLGYRICDYLQSDNENNIYVPLEFSEDKGNKTKCKGYYFTATQELCFEAQMCEYTITPGFTTQKVIETEGNWAEAALLPQGLPEGKTGIEGISAEIQAAAQWWTNLLKNKRQEDVENWSKLLKCKTGLCLYSSKQLEVFEQTLREIIAEKIAETGYNPMNPFEESYRRYISSYGTEIKRAANVAQMDFDPIRDLCVEDPIRVQINPGLVIASFRLCSSDYFTIYEHPPQQKPIGWLQRLFNLYKKE